MLKTCLDYGHAFTYVKVIIAKFNGDGISMMAAGMLGGAIGGAVLLLIIALVYNSAIARDSVRRGRRRVTHGMGTPIL